VDAGRKAFDRARQRADEVQIRASAIDGVGLRHSLGAGRRQTGKPPYGWALLWEPGHRADMLKNGWKSIGKLFILVVLLDVVYQVIVLRFVHPGKQSS